MSNQSSQARPVESLPLVQRLAREPLLHFLLLAGLLFVAQAIFASDDRDVIVVDVATQDFLIKQEQDLLLRPLTDDEKDAVVNSFIEEEILVREAVKRGFSDSSRVRALLLQNMRFFIAGDIQEPTDEVLQAYFDANLDAFTSPPSFDLGHVMYASGSDVPPDILEQLNSGANPATFGVATSELTFGQVMRFMTQRRLVQAFGPETAQSALAALETDDQWHGPFLAPTGSKHFLRVEKRNPPSVPEFEQAKDWIATQWLADKSRELLDEELSKVEQDYRIDVIPRAEADGGA